MIALILARKNIYYVGLMWGGCGIVMSGLLAGTLQQAGKTLGLENIIDASYHYHISAVIAALVAILALFFFGIRKQRSRHHESLTDLFGALLFFDFIALLLGAGASFGVGWFKEVFDATQGRFMDANDIHADVSGIMQQTIFSLTLLLPPHVFFWMFGEFLRRTLVGLATPTAARKFLDKARETEARLAESRLQITAQYKSASRLEQEIACLEQEWAILGEAAQNSPAGLSVKKAVQEKQDRLQASLAKIMLLEKENQNLRNSLNLLQKSAGTGSQLLRLEISGLISRSLNNAGIVAQTQTLLDKMAKSSANVLGAELVKTNFPQATTPVSANDGQAELAALRDTLKIREEQAGEMEREIASLRTLAADYQAQIADLSPQRVAKIEETVQILKRKVLLVDDDRSLIRMMTAALNETGLIEATPSLSAIEAIEMLRQAGRRPDLIILDIKMPNFSGPEFFASLQKSKKFAQVPIIFCSGCPPETVPELANLDYAAYIRKPFSLSNFQKTVFEHLGLSVPASASTVG
jgi:CheY-like chemotaxis protein